MLLISLITLLPSIIAVEVDLSYVPGSYLDILEAMDIVKPAEVLVKDGQAHLIKASTAPR